MHKLFSVCLIILVSCNTSKMIPLSGQYPATPMLFTSEKPFDKTWDNLVDLFAQRGLAIKLIDRSSGLIISDRSKLTVTMEDKNGRVIFPDAYIVAPSHIVNGKRIPLYVASVGAYSTAKQVSSLIDYAYGDWNVRIKPNPSGGSTINVNITSIVYETYDYKLKANVSSPVSDIRSTGVFEKQLAEAIK